MSQRREAEIVVIGAGIWGLSVAYHLGSLGFGDEVLVMERQSGVSELVSPQSLGAIRTLQSSSLLVRSACYSRELFENFAKHTNHVAGFVRTGAIYATIDEARSNELDEMASITARAGVQVETLTSADAQKLVPNFCFDDARSIYWLPADGYVHLPTAGAALAAASLDLGVRFATGLEAASLIIEEHRIRAVKTSTRTVETSKIIMTGGIWNSELTRSLRIPTPGTRRQRNAILTTPIGLDATHPIVHLLDRNLSIRAERGGYLCNFRDDEDYESHGDRAIAFAREALSPFLPLYGSLKLIERCGSPAMSVKDGLLIGTVPGVRGLWVASSGGDSCITLAAAVGRWLARSAVNGNPGDDISAYGLEAQEYLAVERV